MNRFVSAPWALIAAGLLAVAIAAAPAGAQVPPDERWRTFETENFRVTFPAGVEDRALHAARRAELRRAQLAAILPPPGGAIDILLADNLDVPGGFATSFPSNRIVLYASPPAPDSPIGYHDDWIDLVVLHELVHIFHLERTGRLGAGLRALFGRVPLGWPFFPGYASPTWVLEGLAVHLESALTGYGRVHGSIPEMVVRTAVLEDAFERIDQADGYGPTWPGAHRRYILGGKFLDYLARSAGEDFTRDLVEHTTRTWLPPPLYYDVLGRRATGRSFTEAWNDWRAELRVRYAALADSLAAAGLTEPETLTSTPYFDLYARTGPDGRIAFGATDGRSDRAIFVLDPESGEIRRAARTNGAGAVGWLPDGELIAARLEFADPYRVYSDLVRVAPSGRTSRETRRMRLSDPDADRDGRRVVAVQAAEAAYRIVVLDLRSGELRPVTPYSDSVHWSLPRWDPAGERIAAGRWRRGGDWDVVVLDTLGTVLREVAPGPGIAAAPAWSPDGRYLLFWSDRTGIPNLFAADLAGSADRRPLQVTNVLTGAFSPDVSRDGRWIYFVGYAADGMRLQRIPFEPHAWRPVAAREPAASPAAAAPARPGSDRGAVVTETAARFGDSEPPPARPYRPLATLRPYFWLPVLEDRGRAGVFMGAHTAGQDLVGRHAFAAAAAFAPIREVETPDDEPRRLERAESRFAGVLTYAYAGFANPVLGLRAERSWDFIGVATLEDGSRHDVLARDHEFAIGATLVRRRWRSSASLGFGADVASTRYHAVDLPDAAFLKPTDELLGVFGRATFSTARAHRYSISLEDGVVLRLGARHRHDRAPASRETDEGSRIVDASYDEVNAFAAAYKSLPLPGFARHVIAVRGSGVIRTGPGARLQSVGGVSGSLGAVALGDLTGTGRFLPVRGFDSRARAGTRGWSASFEYRAPLALLDRGYRLLPFYLDRLAATAFLDAGNVWCSPAEAAASSRCPEVRLDPLLSAGAELGLDLGLFFSPPTRFRFGFAAPIRGPASDPVFFVAAGHAF